MGFNFRKSIKILPGVRVNIGKKGVSGVTVGKRGTSVSVGKKGTYFNKSLGGGLSFRHKIGDKQNPRNRPAQSNGNILYAIFGLLFLFALAFLFLVLGLKYL